MPIRDSKVGRVSKKSPACVRDDEKAAQHGQTLTKIKINKRWRVLSARSFSTDSALPLARSSPGLQIAHTVGPRICHSHTFSAPQWALLFVCGKMQRKLCVCRLEIFLVWCACAWPTVASCRSVWCARAACARSSHCSSRSTASSATPTQRSTLSTMRVPVAASNASWYAALRLPPDKNSLSIFALCVCVCYVCVCVRCLGTERLQAAVHRIRASAVAARCWRAHRLVDMPYARSGETAPWSGIICCFVFGDSFSFVSSIGCWFFVLVVV